MNLDVNLDMFLQVAAPLLAVRDETLSEKKQFKFLFKFLLTIINQHELRREFRHVFARATLVLPSGMRLCQRRNSLNSCLDSCLNSCG